VLDQQLIAQIQACFPDMDATELQARLRREAEAHYTALVAGLACGQATLEPMIVAGTPFLKIVQLARDLDVDMIVMTVHRGTVPVEQMLFGSTAERVLRLAPCAVLIVPCAVAPQPPALGGRTGHTS
jgi:nucleotide-binding universal stress UspA family protein